MKAVARAVPSPQPCIVARASDGNVKDAFLVIERSPLIKKISVLKSCSLVQFSSYYAFNVHYPDGCCNFFTLLEVLFLNRKVPPRKPRLSALASQLQALL